MGEVHADIRCDVDGGRLTPWPKMWVDWTDDARVDDA